MLKVGVIGLGNAGNQIAKLAKEAGFDAIALNSSERDLQTVKDVVAAVTIGDEKGAGKDRSIAKSFIKEAAPELLQSGILDEAILDRDIVLLPTSLGGGTGSGMTPVLRAALAQLRPETHFIIVGIVPTISESLAAQQNTLEFLQEMKRTNPTYMLYDNAKYENLGPVSMIQTVNKEIIEDFKTIRGDYQVSTPFTSIDEKDAMKIYQTPGRVVVGRAYDFKEKDLDAASIEERIINHIKLGAHAELETDRIVKRLGLIVNLPQSLYETLDTTIPQAKKVFGEPVEGFEHIAVDDRYTSRVIVAMSGLSFPDDRIQKTIQRIEEVQAKLAEEKESILDSYDVRSVGEVRKDAVVEVDVKDVLDIFNDYE